MSPSQPPSGNRRPSLVSNPDSVRARENQRRSRARRKEYLQELEAKLRTREALGVQASIDIQSAARTVSEENARLRKENLMLREENERLRDSLKDSDERAAGPVDSKTNLDQRREFKSVHDRMDDAVSARVARIGEATGPAVATNDMQSGGENMSPCLRPPMRDTRPLHIPSPYNLSQFNRHPSISSRDDRPSLLNTKSATNQSQPESTCHSSRHASTEGMSLDSDTSSCEYAAQIITSMRADVSADDVRADLGCDKSVTELRQCKVNNSKLFLAMDRYTG